MIYDQEDIEEALRTWQVVKVNNMINDGVNFEKMVIPNKTDVLLETIIRKNIIMFKKLLKKGFPVMEGKFLYLHHAIRINEIMFVDLLLNHTSNQKQLIDKLDQFNGNNCLHIACNIVISQEIILYLSLKGADWNTQNIYGQTPLHALLRYYSILNMEIIKEITSGKVKFTIKDRLGISCKDIIKSLALDEDWRNEESNIYLINYINDLI